MCSGRSLLLTLSLCVLSLGRVFGIVCFASKGSEDVKSKLEETFFQGIKAKNKIHRFIICLELYIRIPSRTWNLQRLQMKAALRHFPAYLMLQERIIPILWYILKYINVVIILHNKN